MVELLQRATDLIVIAGPQQRTPIRFLEQFTIRLRKKVQSARTNLGPGQIAEKFGPRISGEPTVDTGTFPRWQCVDTDQAEDRGRVWLEERIDLPQLREEAIATSLPNPAI